MMEAPIAPTPTLLATNLPPGTYKATPLDMTNAQVNTISSNVPMKYNRKVKFSNTVKQSSSSGSESPELTQISDGDEEKIQVRARPASIHLTQMESLSATSLYQRQTHVNMRPRIEIRLRRPCSLHDVSGEVVAKIDDQISIEQETNQPKGKKGGLKWVKSFPGYFNKRSFFGSSPNLASFDETSKEQSDDDSSLTRSRTASGSSYDSMDSPSQSRKSDIFRRFKRKKSNVVNKVPLRIEIFKKQDITKLQLEGQDGRTGDDIGIKNMGVESTRDTAVLNDLSPLRNSDTPISEDSSPIPFPSRAELPREENNHSQTHRAQLLFHFTCQIPCEGGINTYPVFKDATHILPLKDNETLVTDILSNKMILFSVDGVPKVSFIFDEASEPWASCLTLDGTLAVTLRRHRCVSLWSLSGLPLSEFGQDVLVAPTGIQVDSKGRFVVADEKTNRVSIFDGKGQFLHTIDQSQEPHSLSSSSTDHFNFDQPRYVCITNNGKYVITDSANHCVRIFDSNGHFCNRIGSFGQRDGQFRFPYGVTCDKTDLIYVADHFNHRISVFNIHGVFQYHAVTHEDGISRPKGVAVQNTKMYVSHGSLRANKISVFDLPRHVSRTITATKKRDKVKSVKIENNFHHNSMH